MNKYFHIFLALSLFASFSASAYERGKTRNVNGKEITLKNKCISMIILPERAGRISSLSLTDKNLELLTPGKVSVVEETPLFSYSSDNMMGVYELIWRAKINGTVGMEYTVNANKITFTGKFYGNTEVDLTREVTLVPDALAIEVKSTFTNTAKTDQSLAPWIHLVGAPLTSASLPLAPGTHRRDGFGLIGKNSIPKLFTFGKHNNYLPPGDNWVALRRVGKNVVWALRLPEGTLDKEGVFYSWGNGKDIQSAEVIWPKHALKPQGKFTINYSLEIFDGLDTINALWGNTGLSLTMKDGKAVLNFVASRKEPARKGVLEWKTGSKDSGKYPFAIPALAPGKSAEVILPLKAIPETALIRESSTGKTITLFF
ncbi:MAG: hypothetical protein J6W00_10370 [Lentisphaeria bacterium]|nr:hypothetical protein [Lentisphaeria bacterium]